MESVGLTLCPPFDLHQSSIPPQLTDDGKPYGPTRYKELMREAYCIIKNTNVTYNDVLGMSPTERRMILSFLVDEAQKSKKALEDAKAQAQAKKVK